MNFIDNSKPGRPISRTHFLLECNSYADEWCLLFQSIAAHLPSFFPSLGVEQKFVLSTDPTVIMCVAKFVHVCFLKRNELISCLCSHPLLHLFPFYDRVDNIADLLE